MTAADRPSVTDNARAEAERRYGTPDFAAPNDRTIKYAAFIEGAEWAAGRAETTTDEWPRCKASRDGACDRCHDEHGRHIHCRAETTTATDEAAEAARAITSWVAQVRSELAATEAAGIDLEENYLAGVHSTLRQAEEYAASDGLLATARARPTREQIARAISRGVDGMCEWDYDNASVDYRNEMLEGADAVLALLADQPTEAEAGARALEQAITEVRAVYDMQCNPLRRETFADDDYGRGAWTAHRWWERVLGGALVRLTERAARLRGGGPR